MGGYSHNLLSVHEKIFYGGYENYMQANLSQFSLKDCILLICDMQCLIRKNLLVIQMNLK